MRDMESKIVDGGRAVESNSGWKKSNMEGIKS